MMPREILAAPIDRRKGPSVRRGTKLKRFWYSKTEPSTDLEIKLFRGSSVPEKQSWLPPRHRVAGLRKRDVGFISHLISSLYLMYDMTDLLFNTGGVCVDMSSDAIRGSFCLSLFVLSFLYPFFLCHCMRKEYYISSLVSEKCRG